MKLIIVKIVSVLLMFSVIIPMLGVNCMAMGDDEFNVVRSRITDYLLDEKYAYENEDNKKLYNEKIQSIVKQAENDLVSMNKYSNRATLWEDNNELNSNLSRVNVMAKAYSMKGSPLKGSKALLDGIISGSEYIYLNQYNENTEEIGNWWGWEVGYAKSAVSIVALAYDGLTSTQVERYLRGVQRFCPDPYEQQGKYTSSGANRVDICYSILIASICKKDVAMVEKTCKAILDVFKFVEKGDGFYADGSFLQHGTTAYSFSYGDVLLDGLSLIMGFVAGTKWEINDPLAQNLYTWIYDAYEPLIYKGAAMDMVRGRAISRDYSGRNNGHSVLNSIIRITEFAPDKYKSDLKSMIKYHFTEDTVYDYTNINNITILTMAKKIMDDKTVIAKKPLVKNKVYNSMDRVSHLRNNYGIGLALNSERISKYESINNENLKGWYTGDGTLYLYNNDLNQFDYHYFYTVDPYRFPGTTVDKQIRADSSEANAEGRNSQSAVGSANLFDLYSVTGMSIQGLKSSLSGKKGWFMFDDEIVCLGSDISSTDNVAVETIVENRKLAEEGVNEVTINDSGAKLQDFENEQSFDNVNWIHLEGNVQNSDIGYYFPNPTTINAVRQSRTHNIQENNPTRTSKTTTANYFTAWIDHGVNPKKQEYAYVLLPNKSVAEVKKYAEEAPIIILANDDSVQAVRHNKLNVTGYNFWQNKAKTLGDITCYTQAAVMMKKDDVSLELSVCDITQKNNDGISLDILGSGYSLLSADDGVDVKFDEKSLKINIDTKNAKGKQFRMKFVKMDSMPSEEIIKTRVSNCVAMIINSDRAMVNGVKTTTDGGKPCILDGLVYVPVRFLIESLGGEIKWDEKTDTAIINYSGTEIEMCQNIIKVNNKQEVVENSIFLIQDRLMASAMQLCKLLDKKIYWNNKGLLIIGNDDKLFNSASETKIIDDLIVDILH